jgi:hypothetical protein
MHIGRGFYTGFAPLPNEIFVMSDMAILSSLAFFVSFPGSCEEREGRLGESKIGVVLWGLNESKRTNRRASSKRSLSMHIRSDNL